MTSSSPVPSFDTAPISSGRSSARWRRATHPEMQGGGEVHHEDFQCRSPLGRCWWPVNVLGAVGCTAVLTSSCGGGGPRGGGRRPCGGFAPPVPSRSAPARRQRERFSARNRAAGHAAARRPRTLNPPTSMTFAWSGVSPGSSLHLAVILVAGFSLLLLANRIAGGRFIRRVPLSVGPVLPQRTGPERVVTLGTSPRAHKLIGEICARAHPRYTLAQQ